MYNTIVLNSYGEIVEEYCNMSMADVEKISRGRFKYSHDRIIEGNSVTFELNDSACASLYMLLHEGKTTIHDIIASHVKYAGCNAVKRTKYEIGAMNTNIGIANKTWEYTAEYANINKVNWEGLFKKHGEVVVCISEEDSEPADTHNCYNVKLFNEIVGELRKRLYDHVQIRRSDYDVEIHLYVKNILLQASDYRELSYAFDDMIWSHGLLAFNQGSAEINAQDIVEYNDMEICCAHESQFIGPIGLFIKGQVQCVSNVDLCSKVGINGKRVFKHDDYIIDSVDKIDLNKHSHMEAIVSHAEIVGIWIKEDIMEKDLTHMLEITGLNIDDVRIVKEEWVEDDDFFF